MTYTVSPARGTPVGASSSPDHTETTTAVVRHAYGAPGDVLRVARVPRPSPGPGQVRIEVRAAGVERGTWHLVTGRPRLLRLAYGLRRPRAAVPGLEVAGVVDAIGPGVDRFAVGDEVWGNATSGWAEHAVVRVDKLAARPAGTDWVGAAASATSGTTALQAVQDHAALAPGQHVLITGAAGGIGTFAVQLAVHLGAEVTATARPEHRDLVVGLGAHHVIDHTTEPISAHGTRYDAIVDLGGHRSLRELRRSLAPRGRLVIVGSEPDRAWLGGTDRQLRALLLSPFVSQRLGTFVASEHTEHLEALGRLLTAGMVVPTIDRTFPLAEAAAALDHLAGGHPGGKVVLEVSGG